MCSVRASAYLPYVNMMPSTWHNMTVMYCDMHLWGVWIVYDWFIFSLIIINCAR